MIRFEAFEKEIPSLHNRFASNHPFPHIILDNFADPEKLAKALESVPTPASIQMKKSRDYIFAKNKFEKANFRQFSPELDEVYRDLTSDRFHALLRGVTGESVFVDKEFFGGGIHQGGKGSFLDMHADFNYHPINRNWFRNFNILLYLNQGWKTEYGGHLKLRDARTGYSTEIEPRFNRCVIMLTRKYTLHGYNRINFPPGSFRRLIAAYAYTLHQGVNTGYRSTVWRPDSASAFKKTIGAQWPVLVKIKNLLFGIGTSNNK
jgi:Rps23 Pro-64 3,4-dihydroxylase Tpa1-like proline 4-hydroxylase